MHAILKGKQRRPRGQDHNDSNSGFRLTTRMDSWPSKADENRLKVDRRVVHWSNYVSSEESVQSTRSRTRLRTPNFNDGTESAACVCFMS